MAAASPFDFQPYVEPASVRAMPCGWYGDEIEESKIPILPDWPAFADAPWTAAEKESSAAPAFAKRSRRVESPSADICGIERTAVRDWSGAVGANARATVATAIIVLGGEGERGGERRPRRSGR